MVSPDRCTTYSNWKRRFGLINSKSSPTQRAPDPSAAGFEFILLPNRVHACTEPVEVPAWLSSLSRHTCQYPRGASQSHSGRTPSGTMSHSLRFGDASRTQTVGWFGKGIRHDKKITLCSQKLKNGSIASLYECRKRLHLTLN